MQLRERWIFAMALAMAAPALAAPPRLRDASPFALTPRAVGSTTAKPAAALTANPGTPVRMGVGGMVAVFEADESVTSIVGKNRPAGLQAIMETGEDAAQLQPSARPGFATLLEKDASAPQGTPRTTPLAGAASQTHIKNTEGGE